MKKYISSYKRILSAILAIILFTTSVPAFTTDGDSCIIKKRLILNGHNV